jgi:hypothetical protein
MKNIITTIYNFFHAMGKAKAASAMARAGMHKEARDLMAS